MHGGAGTDTLIGAGCSDTMWGDAGNDRLTDEGGADGCAYGGDGSDTIKAVIADTPVNADALAAYCAEGNAGNDRIRVDVTAQSIIDFDLLPPGTDVYDACADGTASSQISGGEGNDSIRVSAGAESAPEDVEACGRANTENVVFGDAGNDRIFATAYAYGGGTGTARISIDGGTGTDTIAVENVSFGIQGDTETTLIGGDGRDVLKVDAIAGGEGGTATDFLDGGAANDVLSVKATVGGWGGINARTTLLGGDGDDRLTADITASGGEFGRGSNISLDGGSGSDRLALAITFENYANNYDPWDVALLGGDGNDVLGFSVAGLPAGGGAALTAADTVLDGGAGNDHITGSVVAETLIDGLGRDTLAGGGGADVFRLAAGDDALDRITGFSGAGGEGDKVDLTLFGADPVVAFAAGILSVDGEDVVRISGSFDPATDLILA
jgi:Ca2+-binding RTX toxin-like protein